MGGPEQQTRIPGDGYIMYYGTSLIMFNFSHQKHNSMLSRSYAAYHARKKTISLKLVASLVRIGEPVSFLYVQVLPVYNILFKYTLLIVMILLHFTAY